MIPRSYCGAEDPVLPFIDTLIHDFFAYSNAKNYVRRYEILKYRYGLRGQSQLTLEDVGIIYDITRERVRQIEGEVKTQLRKLLANGEIIQRNLKVRIQPDYLAKLIKFRESFEKLDGIEREETLVEHTSTYFDVVNLDIAAMRLLFELYGFRRITLSRKREQFAWVIGNVEWESIQRAIDSSFRYLREQAIAKPFDDILLYVNKRQRSNRVTRDALERALALSNDIECEIDQGFRVMYERLGSITDKIYRILHSHGEPIHLRDIARLVNSTAFQHGEKLRMNIHNVGNRLSADERFVSIGRSGLWALEEWDVETDNVLSLMEDALHATGKPLTSDQIYEYVRGQRPAKKTAIDSYLSYENRFIRVGKNLFALADWGIESVSNSQRKPRNRVLSKAKLAEYIERTFKDLDESELFVTDLAAFVLDLDENLHYQHVYNAVLRSPAITVVSRREGKTARNIAQFNPKYRSKLSKQDILTRDVPILELIQQTTREILRDEQQQTMPLSLLRDSISERLSCPPASVYTAIGRMDDIQKEKAADGRHLLCRLIETSDSFAPLVARIAEKSIRVEAERALRMLHVDTVDLALFQLGKLFENSIRQYIDSVEANGQYSVTKKDKGSLFNMVNWAENCGLISDKSASNYLRLERNDRAHGSIPDLDEREAMLSTSRQIVKFYLEYIAFFIGRIKNST